MKTIAFVVAWVFSVSICSAQVRDVRVPPRLESGAGDTYTFVRAQQVTKGVRVNDGELPWQVGLLIQSGDELLLCGGAAVGPRTVLTAAHCVESAEKDWSKVVVISGAVDINSAAGMRAVASGGSIHENYNPRTLENDLAVVYAELASTVQLIEPSTPFLDDSIADGAALLVSGWGRTDRDADVSVKLLKTDVRSISRDKCNDAQRYDKLVTAEMMCAGGTDGADACSGDSGGPLVLIRGGQARLIGIVSWGKGCGEPRFPGVYTQVGAFLPWIIRQYRAQPEAPADSEVPAQ